MQLKKPRKNPLPAPGMEAFHTRSRANEGHKLPLFTPEGRATAHWLLVRGCDSDAFRMAKNRESRRTVDLAQMAPEDAEAEVAESVLRMQAALIADWSFEMECSPENVVSFLREAPQIAAKVDEFASRRDFFFKLPSTNLKTTPAPSSN